MVTIAGAAGRFGPGGGGPGEECQEAQRHVYNDLLLTTDYTDFD